MPFELLKLIVIQLVLPAALIFTLWKGAYQSKIEWIGLWLSTLLCITWLFFVAPWDLFSYYWRFIWLILLLVAVYTSWKKARALPIRVKFNRSQKWSIGINGMLILVFGFYHVPVFTGYSTQDQAIELDFPLKKGPYYVGQGGNHVQINYHHAHLAQQYALDIVKLNKMGVRTAGIYPKELEKYAIYGEELTSPCNAEVLEVRNDLPDLSPPAADPANAKGNYVKLTCEDVLVYIAHMQEGSVVVEVGEDLQTGQKIGLVGNSGNTTEPHLHMHAEKDGVGVPIEFDGRFLVRNSLVW